MRLQRHNLFYSSAKRAAAAHHIILWHTLGGSGDTCDKASRVARSLGLVDSASTRSRTRVAASHSVGVQPVCALPTFRLGLHPKKNRTPDGFPQPLGLFICSPHKALSPSHPGSTASLTTCCQRTRLLRVILPTAQTVGARPGEAGGRKIKQNSIRDRGKGVGKKIPRRDFTSSGCGEG